MAIYFIDSISGNDSYDGLSPESAFKSLEKMGKIELSGGDRILLKKDCVFKGSLTVSSSGKEGLPIEISAYGQGFNKPAIITEDCEYAVSITGEYVVLDGLEISNPKGHYGIQLKSEIHGATRGVTVKNCYIHDVWTVNNLGPRDRKPQESWHHHAGGISVETNREAPTWYENLRIENNILENINRTGIWLGGQWFNRYKNSFPWVTNKADGMNDPWYPHKNVYIAYNTVDHPHGDGIIGIGCRKLLMEHNKVYYANCMSRVGACNAGLWSMCCDGAVIQYNEVAYTGLEYGGDGEAFDIDNCSNNTVVQYNYSHHNEGGFMLVCNIVCNSKESHHDNIIRNNLSVDDANKHDSALFNFTGAMRNVSVLNNTVYTSVENRYRFMQVADYANVGIPQDVLFGNNLFYSVGTKNWNCFMANGNFVFDNNFMYNMPSLPKKENITETGNYYNCEPALKGDGAVPGTRLETEGFVPEWNSPLLRSGKHFPDCSDTDYRGLCCKGHNYIGAFYLKDANIG